MSQKNQRVCSVAHAAKMLERAHGFVDGFTDDEQQEGIAPMLVGIVGAQRILAVIGADPLLSNSVMAKVRELPKS